MRSSTVVLPLLASLAVAQPYQQVHQHAKHHVARNEPVVEWVTEYAYATEVVPVTKTIWVSSGFVAPTPTTTSSAAAKATVPAQFFQPASKKPASSITTTLSTVVSSAKPTTTSSTTSSVAPPPPAAKAVEPSTTSTTTTSAPVSTPVSVYTPPPAAETSTTVAPVSVAPVVAASTSSSTSSGGECSKGSSCNGDMTYYDAGLGACGWTTDGETEDVVALSHVLMGTQSNGNPYCGKTITIKLNGKSIVAKVVDKCMGCEIHAIDLSNHAFKQLEDMGVGRTQAEWYFN